MKAIIKSILGVALFFIVPAGFAQVTSPQDLQQQNNYSNWDSNQDDRLDDEEFNSFFNTGAYYGNWDSNGDKRIDENEWNTGVSDRYEDFSGMYSDWDMDGDSYVNEDEFSRSTFNLWDEDTDGYISQEEFNTWSYEDDER